MSSDLKFPRMLELRQHYPPTPHLDIRALLQQQFAAGGIRAKIRPGMRIAVGVGSRGISNIREIIRALLDELLAAGARPFLMPAMGSHGGATPEGQQKLLAGYGITAESMGVPMETSMEVTKIGTAFDDHDIVFSSAALSADGIVVVNRIKPHTDFRGTLGSGLQKMLVIGYGKQVGAANAHGAAVHLGYEKVFREYARVILGAVPLLCGVAILEDQHHGTAKLQVITPENIVHEEDRLLEEARSLMPRLPLNEIDLLIVDEIGKEISGSGMDTNIIGRDITGYSTSLQPETNLQPRIYRIFVRNLTGATNGNGVGLGLADFTTTRAARALDARYTYINALTSIGLQVAKVPIHFDSDRETLEQAIPTLAPRNIDELRIIRIRNTLSLDRMLISEACVNDLHGRKGVEVAAVSQEMLFDAEGNLLPL